ncbi:Protein winged eye [Gryllus bimaculatus]|nr:Protein winged eye [Gryllus bimaculatus]
MERSGHAVGARGGGGLLGLRGLFRRAWAARVVLCAASAGTGAAGVGGWFYCAAGTPVPVQLGPTEHVPLPPVGYQLVRDPITGHLLLIPATNIEHLQRAVLWPSYPATLQPSLHMAAQPTTQHIQLFESTEPSEFLSTLSAAHNHSGPTQGQTARILVQPQLTLTAAESPLPKRKGTVIKVEATDCSALEVKTPGMSRPPEVAVTANTATQVFSGNTSVAHFYYEHPTAVVQLAQTPQPTAAVQTDNGKRSQATSPVNPAETSLTPPPEAASVQLESEDSSNNVNLAGACGNGESSAVQVQDASNQTDTPPVSEDETGDTNSASLASSCFQTSKTSSTTEPHALPPTSLPAPVITTTTITSSITTPVITTTNASEEHNTPPIPESARDLKPRSAETILPVVTKPPTQNQVVDVSGLELLSNSIEQFESHCSLSDTIKQSEKVVEQPLDGVNSQVVNGLLTLSGTPVETLAPEKQIKPKQEVDLKPADEKAAETLQMLCQQGNIKVEPVQSNEETENCDKVLTSSKSKTVEMPVPTNSDLQNEKTFEQHLQITESDPSVCNNNSNNLLGGLGLLCALAEQRIMEEGAGNGNIQSQQVNIDISPETSSEIKKTVDCENKSSSVDVNRNYKTRKSERECKKFIANKVMQYFHQNGNRSGSSSPQHSGAHSVCTSPSSAEIMDAMELDMRMRLAELQRKYREKQRELSKLTPKKTSSSESSGGVATDSVGTIAASPTKRGPGRPRKKCNKLNLESSPLPSPSTPPAVNGQLKPRVGRPPLLKGKDVISNKELPPPVLEKVTDTRPRSRFDSEDCAAPKLKASKLDILKPPTLTANKIASYSKLKPAVLSGNITTKGLKLPQCNVNLVKLTSHNGNLKMKDSGMKTLSESSSLKKSSCSSLLEEARSKLGSVFSSDKTEKHSAFLSCRLPLVHTACHTFGSKPLSCLTHPGDDTHSWFRTTDKPLGSISHIEQDASSVESSDSSASRKPKLLPSSLETSLSSSKKRKVGRPKKHPTGAGFEDATETIVAKKPKSKSSLVGFLLSRSRNAKVNNALQSSPTSTSSSSSSSTPIRTFGQSLDVSYCSNKIKNCADGSKISPINGSNLLPPSFAKAKIIKSDEASDHKPNKIRPKLKAEAKVKTWTWAEEDDPESMDWTSEQVSRSREALKDEWAKKLDKTEKSIVKSSLEVANRINKRKLSLSDSKSIQGCPKAFKKSTNTGTTSASTGKASNQMREKESPSDLPSAPKKHKRSSSGSSANQGSAGGTTTSSCVLTQTHLNEEKLRALTVMGGLFYAGTLSAIRAPDVYGITIDGERGNRPHIYSREEILRDAILEVRPSSIATLTPGTRLCAYWSQQYRCLYPGTVAQPTSPDPELDSHFVNVEFDDGDSGRINIDDIRLLPPNYPTLEYDPNPLLTLGKRRRRNSGASCDRDSKDRRANAEALSNTNTNVPNSSAKNNFSSTKQMSGELSEKTKTENDSGKNPSDKCSSASKKSEGGNITSKSLLNEEMRKLESGTSYGKSDNIDRTNKERKRLKKRRKEKLKKLLSCAGSLTPDAVLKKRRKKHRCSEEHCKHKKHHKRHRKHKHRHGNRNKDSSSGSSGESSSKSGNGRSDALTRLSPVLEQLDILEIQQTALKQLTSGDNNNSSRTTTNAKVDISSSGTSASTGSEDEEEPEAPPTVHAKATSGSSTLVSSEGPKSNNTSDKETVSIAAAPTTAAVTTAATASSTITTTSTTTSCNSNSTGSSSSTTTTTTTTTTSTTVNVTASCATDKDSASTADTENGSAISCQDGPLSPGKKAKKDKETGKPKKHRDRQPSVENRSKIAAFLPARQLWGWSGRGFKRPGAKGRGKKEFYKAIQRGKETIMVGDCAVFLSTGRPDRPYIGRIESMWEAWGTNMVVRVKWFYHPEETNGCTVQLKYPGALFESPHVDENDVQTISHKCEVLPLDGYTGRLGTEPERYSSIYDNNDIYYLAGYYDPTTSQLSMKPGVV